MTGDVAILVIDDDPHFLEISRRYLESGGFRDITMKRSAQEALDILKSRTFDVIVSDYHLPPGINSIELLKLLKAEGNETPFIIFTGKSREEVAIEALNNGAAYYLQKGLEIDAQFAELRNMILHLAEKKRAKEKVLLQEAELREKNKELESFCYSISHDLRAPLRVIDGYCEVIDHLAGKEFSPEVRNYFEGVRIASVRMNAMIESLLKFSRAGRLSLACQELDLSTLVRDMVRSLQSQQPGRMLTLEIDPGIVVHGDRVLLMMALENLVGNAWKYTGKKSQAQIAFRMKNEGGCHIYSISDNGAGFDAAHAENLFRPFTRFHTESEFPGTGIGLATVHRIIERHGGRIWAESTPGQGASFFFTLPDCRKTDQMKSG
jgi:signal transduction histidine kinase